MQASQEIYTHRKSMTDVTVPLATSAVTGLLLSCVVVSVVAFLSVIFHWHALLPVGVWFLTFSVASTTQWILIINKPTAGRTSQIPEPPEPKATPEILVTVHTKGNRNTADALEPGDTLETYGLHIRPNILKSVMRSCASGAHKWSYRSLSAIPGLSETQAARLLDEMLAARLLTYRDGQKNHPKGHELTASGRALARRVTAEVTD